MRKKTLHFFQPCSTWCAGCEGWIAVCISVSQRFSTPSQRTTPQTRNVVDPVFRFPAVIRFPTLLLFALLLFVLTCKLIHSCKITSLTSPQSEQLLPSEFLYLVYVMSDHVVPIFRVEFHLLAHVRQVNLLRPLR